MGGTKKIRKKPASSDKRVKAAILTRRHRLLNELLPNIVIINVPEITGAKSLFIDRRTYDQIKITPSTLKMIINNQYKWSLSGFAALRTQMNDNYIDVWEMICLDPVKYGEVGALFNRSLIKTIEEETNNNHFIGEGWCITIGDGPSAEELYNLVDQCTGIYKEPANWQIT